MILRIENDMMNIYLDLPPEDPGCQSIFMIKSQNDASVYIYNSYV